MVGNQCSPMDEAQVRKAVLALQIYTEKQKLEQNKQPLIEENVSLSCIIQRKKVPSKASLKPIPIELPHGIRKQSEMCLLVKDTDKDRVKKILKEDPVEGLTKVMTLKKLRKNFARFEDRRTLVGAYDLFLADDRILPYLKSPVGKVFIRVKKQPVPVRISRAKFTQNLRAVEKQTFMFVSCGACMNVRIAHLGMSVDEIVENIMIGMQRCASLIGKKWNGIQAIHLKTNESVALPIYYSPISFTKLPAIPSAKCEHSSGNAAKSEENKESSVSPKSKQSLATASTRKNGKKNQTQVKAV
uniref:Uncharacterized protein AlNc14C340G10778 n=1 Tax=Albugo laibachii Nc14 TaxID=890382 RepID=F0WX21_9STRA|nr:conserved hypothetical protein [Albugo laibachii Nc14]|eukprot:CCA26010.1 conserved hypothetical protein [Albugo laibachii Nc14]